MKPSSDSEELVEECYKEKTKEIHYVRAKKHGELDVSGIDFIVGLNGHGSEIELQVKTSNTGQTLGIVIPALIAELEEVIPEDMFRVVREHHRKYPSIKHMLFVARTGNRKTKEKVLEEIWFETANNLLPQCMKMVV